MPAVGLDPSNSGHAVGKDAEARQGKWGGTYLRPRLALLCVVVPDYLWPMF